MQKEDFNFDGDTLYIMNVENGEKTLWNGLTEISSDDLEEELIPIVPQEVVDKLNEAAVAICTQEQKIHDALQLMLKEQETKVNDLRDYIVDNLPDDKTPNPIYIPKHIQHRKKGRR